jgi:hypothetical protein
MLKPDMTIHWKAIADGTITFFDSNIFRGKMHFLNFSQKTSVLDLKEISDVLS